MPLSAPLLKETIKVEMTARGFFPDHPETNGEADRFFDALAAAIVTHIQTSAQVAVTGGSSAGVYTVV